MIGTDAVLLALSDAERASLDRLEVFEEIGSTNAYLLEQPGPGPGRFRAVIAEFQTEGRGRQGKRWISPPASGLCLSLSCTFPDTPGNMSGLTLAIGVGIAAALEVIGVDDIALKWPNDIVARDGKLGGILVEARPAGGQRHTVVVGIGLNVDLSRPQPAEVPVTWAIRATDLKECIEELPSRAALAAGILQCLFSTVNRFSSDGFPAFHSAWKRYDWLQGKAVDVQQADGLMAGTADGVDADGALRVITPDGLRCAVSGSVSISSEPPGCE